VIAMHIGHHTDPLDEEKWALWEERTASAAVTAPDHDEPAEDVFERLACCHPGARLLADALAEIGATERNRSILLEFALQSDMGDPSPAVTVGNLHGLRSDAVRQVVHRMRCGLRDLAAREPRFATLGELPVVAA
jgi:hypothetical protein